MGPRHPCHKLIQFPPPPPRLDRDEATVPLIEMSAAEESEWPLCYSYIFPKMGV